MARSKPSQPPKAPERRARQAPIPTLSVEVVWGDITKVEAEVYAVGHYSGVLPQRAEEELDKMVSHFKQPGDRLVITEFAKRGVFRGLLGEVSLFPWDPVKPHGARNGRHGANRHAGPGKLVAVAGMGSPGMLRQPQLRILARSLARTIGILPGRDTLATVLLGSGDGNLGVADTSSILVGEFCDSLIEDPTLHIRELKIVERELDRALEILQSLVEFLSDDRFQERLKGRLKLKWSQKLTEDPSFGGSFGPEFGCSLLLAAIASMDGSNGTKAFNHELDKMLSRYSNLNLPTIIREKFKNMNEGLKESTLDPGDRLKRLAMGMRLQQQRMAGKSDVPSRVVFRSNGDGIIASAITNTVTVAERRLDRRIPLIKREIELLTDPPPKRYQQEGGHDLQRLLVPEDLQEVMGKSKSLVVDVDRVMARVPWEMLPSQPGEDPLGVATQLSRQLSTAYSPRPSDRVIHDRVRVLIVGDPDGNLPDARKEARDVHEILVKKLGKESVTTLIGPPDPGTRAGSEDGFGPADYFEVVKLLLRGDFDIVHYCGHADFDAALPDRAGWVFPQYRLTAYDLDNMERPPVLLVANACLTSQLSQPDAGESEPDPTAPERADHGRNRRYDSRIVASLADEFFRRGVIHYIGTAWEVPSVPAREFALEFYEGLLNHQSVGEAVLRARKTLFDNAKDYGEEGAMAWATYQHYGDPTGTLQFPESQADS